MTRLQVDRQTDVYRRVAIAVGHYVRCPNEGFALAITCDIALDVIKKFYAERRVPRAVQTALDGRVTATTYD